HGLRVVCRHAALRGLPLPEGLLGVTDRSAQAVEAEVLEVVARPAAGFAGPQVPSLALHTQRAESRHDVVVDLDKLLRCIPGAEVAAPSAEDGVQVGDDIAEVRVASTVRRQLLHTPPDALHRALRRPAL